MDNPLSDLVHDTKLSCRVFPHHTMQESYIAEVAGTRPTKQEVKWEHIKILGRGSFGLVWLQRRVSKPGQGQLRAVKDILKDPNSRNGSLDYNRELEAIAKFSQERYRNHFVFSYGWYETDQLIHISMEYMEHGDLQRYLRSSMTESDAWQITRQMVEAIKFMHQNGYAHRDLKPQNILVRQAGPSWWIKVADFGISKRTGRTDLRTQVGTQGYTAPELLDIRVPDSHDENKGTYTLAVDMWSIGVVAFQICVGHLPFLDRQSLVNYVERRSQLNFEPLVPSSYIKFVHATMDPRPSTRLTAKDALMHEWLDNLEKDLVNGPGISIGRANSLDSPPTLLATPSARWDFVANSPTSKEQNLLNVGSRDETCSETVKAALPHRSLGGLPSDTPDTQRDTRDSGSGLERHHELGTALYRQMKYGEAEKQFRQAAQGRKRVLGEEHQDTLELVYWLGQALYA